MGRATDDGAGEVRRQGRQRDTVAPSPSRHRAAVDGGGGGAELRVGVIRVRRQPSSAIGGLGWWQTSGGTTGCRLNYGRLVSNREGRREWAVGGGRRW
jgi:hypothetical protein